MYYSKETELLLLLARVNPDAATVEKARAIISTTIDWNSFLSRTIRHGTSAIIYKNLLKLDNIPPAITGRFRNIYHNSLRSNITMIYELDRILDGLSNTGIDVISLKGAAASEIIFGDLGIYPSGDIDILVHEKDIEMVRKFLEAEGYVLNDQGFDTYREYYIRELYHISLTKEGFTIEPHWNLFMRFFRTPSEFWWEENTIVTSGDRTYHFLSPEKYIMYTAFRLFSKGFIHLRFLVMVAEVVRYYHETTNWEKLLAYAKKYKFENTLRLTLKLCHELLGAPVPDRFREISALRARSLYRRARAMVFIEEDIHPLNKALFIFLHDDLTGTLKVLLRRLFPSMGEIVSRYRLQEGSLKAKLYYVCNPLLLILRRHQR